METYEEILRRCIQELILESETGLIVRIDKHFVQLRKSGAETLRLAVAPAIPEAGKEMLRSLEYTPDPQCHFDYYEVDLIVKSVDQVIAELEMIFHQALFMEFRNYTVSTYDELNDAYYQVPIPPQMDNPSPIKLLEAALDGHYWGLCEYVMVSTSGRIMMFFDAKHSCEEISVVGVTCPIEAKCAERLERVGFSLSYTSNEYGPYDYNTFTKEVLFNTPKEAFELVRAVFEEVFEIELTDVTVTMAPTEELVNSYSEVTNLLPEPNDRDLEG